MKKLLITLVLICFPLTAHSQSTATQVTPGTIGTTQPYFNQYSTSNPMPVSVIGTSGATSGYVYTSNGPGVGATFQPVGGGGGVIPISGGGTNANSQTTNGVAYYNGTAITTGTGFVYNGTSVGIGTSTAFQELSIYGAGPNYLDFGSNPNFSWVLGRGIGGANNGFLTIGNTTGTTSVTNLVNINNGGSFMIGTNVPSPNALLSVGGGVALGTYGKNAVTCPANGLCVSGNMGIGTSAPLQTLDVRGTIAATAILSNGVQFTTSGAGCTVASPVGGSTSGQFTANTTGTCTTTITMNGSTGLTAPNGWHCDVTNRGTGVKAGETTSSQTTATIAIATTSGASISFACSPY